MNQAQIPGKKRRSYVYKVNLELIQHFCFVSITLALARHQEWFLMHSTKTTRAEIDQMDVLTRSKNVQGALNIHKYTESNIEGIINPWEHTTPLFSCRFPSSADEDPLVPWSKGRNREDKRVLHQQKKNSFQTSKHLETESRASLPTFTHQTAGVWNWDRWGTGDWLARFQGAEDVSILREEREKSSEINSYSLQMARLERSPKAGYV